MTLTQHICRGKIIFAPFFWVLSWDNCNKRLTEKKINGSLLTCISLVYMTAIQGKMSNSKRCGLEFKLKYHFNQGKGREMKEWALRRIDRRYGSLWQSLSGWLVIFSLLFCVQSPSCMVDEISRERSYYSWVPFGRSVFSREEEFKERFSLHLLLFKCL